MNFEQILPTSFDTGVGWSISRLTDLTTDWARSNVTVETPDSLSISDLGPGIKISSRLESPSKLLKKESNSFFEPKNEILSLRRSNVVSCDEK